MSRDPLTPAPTKPARHRGVLRADAFAHALALGALAAGIALATASVGA